MSFHANSPYDYNFHKLANILIIDKEGKVMDYLAQRCSLWKGKPKSCTILRKVEENQKKEGGVYPLMDLYPCLSQKLSHTPVAPSNYVSLKSERKIREDSKYWKIINMPFISSKGTLKSEQRFIFYKKC